MTWIIDPDKIAVSASCGEEVPRGTMDEVSSTLTLYRLPQAIRTSVQIVLLHSSDPMVGGPARPIPERSKTPVPDGGNVACVRLGAEEVANGRVEATAMAGMKCPPDAMRGRVAAVNCLFTSNELGEFESGVTALEHFAFRPFGRSSSRN